MTVARSLLLQGLAGKEQEKNDHGMILSIKRGGEEGKEEEWEGRAAKRSAPSTSPDARGSPVLQPLTVLMLPTDHVREEPLLASFC